MRRAVWAVLGAGFLAVGSSGASRATDIGSCPELMQPEAWYIALIQIRNALKHDGQPQLAQAIAALEAGDRPEAVRLLTEIAHRPVNEQSPPAEIYAVLYARVVAWTLSGCPPDTAGSGGGGADTPATPTESGQEKPERTAPVGEGPRGHIPAQGP